jgi:hypothetical protein
LFFGTNPFRRYLTADYERQVFNVSACTWIEGAEENLVTILSEEDEDAASEDGSSSGTGGSSLSGGEIAGIVIGSLVGLIIIGALIAFCIRRQRKKSAYAVSSPEPDMAVITGPVHNASVSRSVKYYSPDAIGTSNETSNEPSNATSTGESNSASHGAYGAASSLAKGSSIASDQPQELDAEHTQIKPTTELDAEAQQIGGPSNQGETLQVPSSHELGGRGVVTTESGHESTVGTTPPRAAGVQDGEEPASPFVSTLGSTGWPEDMGDASTDLVSPTTPTDKRASRPF